MTPILAAEDLTHAWTREGRTARGIEGIHLALHAGEIVALHGAIGSGRSTLLRVLAGFEIPVRGQVLLDGSPVLGTTPAQRAAQVARRVGWPGPAPAPHLSVARFAALGLRHLGTDPAEAEGRVADALRAVGLDRVRQALPDELDALGRIRLGWARCLAEGVGLLLIDQAPLEREIEAARLASLVSLRDTLGVGALIVPRHADLARHADRRWTLDRGQLIDNAAPH